MPENEFEKKVSSEMQELRFKPSESVWPHVEERIKKKKKRRIFVVIFLLAGLALLGYWQRGNLLGEQKNDIATTEKQKDENPGSEEVANSPSSVIPNSETTKQKEAQNKTDDIVGDKLKEDRPIVNKKDIVVSKKEIKNLKKSKGEANLKPVSGKNKIDDKPEVSIDIVSADPKKKTTVPDDLKVKDSGDVKTNPEAIVKQDEIKQPEVKPPESKNDSAKVEINEQGKNAINKTDTLLKTEQANDPSIPIARKDSSEKKWKWGLHITPGVSSLNDHGLALSSQTSADRLYQTPASGGSAAPPVTQKPSDVKAGFSFQAGVFAQRQLSNRTSFSVGLQYGYYSTVLRIGNRRDSLITNSAFANALDEKASFVYNAGGDTVKYTNHYHFIELPLLFHWQLNKNKAKPFIWSTGFTVGQLISTNAIMYDTAFNGIYYQNKKQLNKTQFSLSTGFSWTIANNKRVQWSLGPVVNIHFNKLIDNPFENKGYLFFGGLRTGILFNQKK